MDTGLNLSSEPANSNSPVGHFHLDARAYLRRIKYHGSLTPSVETLWALYQAHCQAVPYENIDLCWEQPLELTEAALFNKIVRQWRGGISCELNGLFAALLRTLGFSVTLIAAQRVDETGQPKSEFQHSMLLVDMEQRWLLDVGSWDVPGVFLALDGPQPNRFAPQYRLTQIGPLWTLWRNVQEDYWREEYLMRFKTRPLSSFVAPKQPSPVAQNGGLLPCYLCMLNTPTGRILLRQARLTVIANGHPQEMIALTPDNWRTLLRAYFGIELPE